MKRLIICALSLFVLFLLSHGALPAEKLKAFEPKSKAIVSLDQMHEDPLGPEKEDKKVASIPPTIKHLPFTSFSSITGFKTNRISAFSTFLTAVFFQSNYVVKPLDFLTK